MNECILLVFSKFIGYNGNNGKVRDKKDAQESAATLGGWKYHHNGGTLSISAGKVPVERIYMRLNLLRAGIDNAKELHAMQVEAFKELLEKYQDFDTSPANEGVEKVEARLKQDFTFYYFICIGQQKVGAVRIIDKKETGKNKRISPIFILPEFQGRGIAQEAIRLCEEMHGSENWELDTILQEQRNCHLYEKMGYRQTGRMEVVNERLTLTFYEKKRNS